MLSLPALNSRTPPLNLCPYTALSPAETQPIGPELVPTAHAFACPLPCPHTHPPRLPPTPTHTAPYHAYVRRALLCGRGRCIQGC